QQLRHLADEDVTTALGLHEVERAGEPTVAPSCDRGHPGRVARVAASTATSPATAPSCAVSAAPSRSPPAARTAAPRRLRKRRQIDAQLLCLHLDVRVERGRRLDAESAALWLLWPRADLLGRRTELAQLVDELLRCGRIYADTYRREFDVPIE